MAKAPLMLWTGCQYLEKRVVEIWDNLKKNNLWKRVLKNVLATTLIVSICLVPAFQPAIGRAAYLGAIATVFGHPGRRFGQMAEALILVVSGTLLGVSWSALGVYLGSLLIESNPPAAYTIRAIFLAVAVVFHGYLRSRTPRLFILVLLMIICATVTLTSTAKDLTPSSVTQILYPILIATGILTLVNVCLFPEFSSSFLGQTTIETLNDTVNALEHAGNYFVAADSPRIFQDTIGKTASGRSWDGKDRSNTQDNVWVEPAQSPAEPGVLATVKRRLHPAPPKHETCDEDLEASAARPDSINMADMTAVKEKIRKKLTDCKATQQECNFELAVAVLPPRDMKPISAHIMKKLVANTIAIINACESKFALVGEESAVDDAKRKTKEKVIGNTQSKIHNGNGTITRSIDSGFLPLFDHDSAQKGKRETPSPEKAELNAVKPKREIAFGDVRLFRYLTARISNAYIECFGAIKRTVDVVNTCIAYVYDVPKLPSGVKPPKGVTLEELDVHMEVIQKALIHFDKESAAALEGAKALEELQSREPDIMPREEVFLISSFMLNVRQAGAHVEDMLKHAKDLVQKRHQRYDRRRVYAPRIKLSKWLYTGGEGDESLPTTGRRQNRKDTPEGRLVNADTNSVSANQTLTAATRDNDIEKGRAAQANASKQNNKLKKTSTRTKKGTSNCQETMSSFLRLRGKAADTVEWIQDSEDLLYAMKLTIAVFIVLWPAFVPSWNTWYSHNRGLWAALQLILITEISIGTSVMTFILRGIGTTLGCLWGWAAFEARDGNRIVCAVMICIGCFPFAYIQLGTKYPKAGMVSIVSICVVALATELETVPGTSTENFLKRWIAFSIGGVVALLVELILFPVKARMRLVESITAALHRINEMEKCIAYGIEEGVRIDVFAADNVHKFERASRKANAALNAAETFLPFCRIEPRLKGSFEGLTLIYSEMLFVLHQIVDRMDNMLQLRTAYGSGPLEEFNADIYPYRRNVAGSITLTIFAIHGALLTKLPLPQFLPSARLAHLRMINRIREVVLETVSQREVSQETTAQLARKQAVRRKYLSWNATSAAQAEIIEFLEELIDLTKLLVGANEFRSGLLLRPTYRDYATGKAEDGNMDGSMDVSEARNGLEIGQSNQAGFMRKRRGTTISSMTSGDEVPASLRRIQSRKHEAGMQRQMTNQKVS